VYATASLMFNLFGVARIRSDVISKLCPQGFGISQLRVGDVDTNYTQLQCFGILDGSKELVPRQDAQGDRILPK